MLDEENKEKIKNKKDRKMNWTLLVAILAFVLSGWIFVQDYLKPFNLSVRASGRVVVARNPYSENLKQDCLLINLIFNNSGAVRGVVEDVAICIHYKNKNVILRSLAMQKDRTLNLQKELPPPQLETFLSFNLAKYESVVKGVLFVPLEKESSFSFEEQLYDADIWVLSGKNWEKYETFGFLITSKDTESLASTQIQYVDEGGRFIKWIIVDKPLASREEQLSKLKELIEE